MLSIEAKSEKLIDKNLKSTYNKISETIGGLTPLKIRKTYRTLGAGGWQAVKNLIDMSDFGCRWLADNDKISH